MSSMGNPSLDGSYASLLVAVVPSTYRLSPIEPNTSQLSTLKPFPNNSKTYRQNRPFTYCLSLVSTSPKLLNTNLTRILPKPMTGSPPKDTIST